MSGKVYTFEGEKVDVTWDGRLCIHIGECGRAAGDLFVSGRKPWCQPNLTTVEDVVDVVDRCPTGALVYVPKAEGIEPEATPTENTVHVANNGPLYLKGDLQIDGAQISASPRQWGALPRGEGEAPPCPPAGAG